MDSHVIHVENLKCGGCAKTITRGLEAIAGISGVSVSPEASEVRFDGDAAALDMGKAKLAQMGYPETGSVEGLKAGLAAAKSYVSCAIGKLG
jgi:copper chaperone